MTGTVNKWRVWCNTEHAWEEVWGPNAPATCPNNHTHEIDTDKTSIIETVTQSFPISDVGTKIWVHSSPKPVTDKTLYVQWVGTGDDVVNHVLGGNDESLMHIHCTPGQYIAYKDMKFDPIFGQVFLHEGHLSWHNAGNQDHISADIMAEPTLVQPYANLNLVVDVDGWVRFSPDGPGTGTHGFAAIPHLLSRSFSMDGAWDYSPATGLTPSLTNTGAYKISIHEQPVHRFMNDIPVYGTNPMLFTLRSDESFLLPPGYFLRVNCHNVSNTEWHATVLVTVFRERTYQP